MDYIIGVDIGTTGTKAISVSVAGETIFSAYAGYAIISDEPEQQELSPKDLLAAVKETIREVQSNYSGKGKLVGISFSCAMHSLILVDDKNALLTNAITWADLRSRKAAERLRNTLSGQRIYERTGTPIHAMSPLCKLIWLREEQPAVFNAAAKFISIKEYIWYSFFYEYRVDHSIASATGLFDIYSFQWNDEALDMAGINTNRLSVPVSTSYINANWKEETCKELKIASDTPAIIGANDGCLANLGSLAIKPGDAALTIGTSGAIRMMSARPKHDVKQRIFNYILSENHYINGGPVNNGGNAIQWYVNGFLNVDGFQHKEIGEWLSEAEKIPAGSSNLICLPYLLGERAPVWDGYARGVFFGIQPAHTRFHFLRSIVEGISFSIYQIGLSVEESIGPMVQLYASGGFIHSEWWLQMIADIFNKPVHVISNADASAIGAALLGLYTLKYFSSLEHAASVLKIKKTYIPTASAHKLYANQFELFAQLYGRLKDLFTAIEVKAEA